MSGSKRKQAAAVSGTVEVPHYDVVALVLQGGGALGAYQAGVYEGLHAAGIRPTWLAGISIGALNAAVIAGPPRSEEHTSELQSLMRNSYALFCLTKKTNTLKQNIH